MHIFHTLKHHHIVQNFFTYAWGNLLYRTVSFIIVPINLHKLAPEDYGLFALVSGIISLMNGITSFGLRAVIPMRYFTLADSDRSECIAHCIGAFMIAIIPIMALLSFFHTPVLKLIFNDALPYVDFNIILALIFFSFFSELHFLLLQLNQQAHALSRLYIVNALIVAITSTVGVWFFDLGFHALLYGQCASAFYLLTQYWPMFSNLPFAHLSIRKIGSYLSLGLPFIPGLASVWIVNIADRWMLAQYAELSAVGIYALADIGAQLFYHLIIHPIQGSYVPSTLSLYAQANEHKHLHDRNKKIMTLVLFAAFICISIGYIIVRPLVYVLMPMQYQVSLWLSYLLMIGSLFLLGTHFLSIPLQHKQRSWIISSSMWCAAVINILLNYFLIPLYGYYGCVAATVCAYAVSFAYLYAIGRKEP